MKKSQKLWKLSIASAMVTGSIVTLVPAAAMGATSFTDMTKAVTSYDAVMSLTSRGVISGFEDGSYRPQEEITRGQAAKLLADILGLNVTDVQDPKFKDVPQSHRFYKYIAALANEKYINGYTDGNYGVNDNLTRGQMARIIGVAYNFGTKALTDNNFTDVNTKAYYAPYLQALIDNEITFGLTKTSFGPDKFVDRGQMAMFLHRSDNTKFGTYVDADVTKIEDGKVVTTEGSFEVADSLKAFFSAENSAALKDSNIIFRVINEKVSAVEQLQLNTSGTSTKELVFDGGSTTIKGNLNVQGDYLHIKNLTVQGTTLISDKSQVATASVKSAATTKSSVIFTDAKLGIVNVSRTGDTSVEVKGKSTVEGFSISSNVTISADTGISIPQVTINEGATQVTIDAPVDNLSVVTTKNLTVDGSGDIKNATVESNGDVKFETKGTIGNLDVKSKDAKVGLGTDTRVGDITLPTGTKAEDVVQDYDKAKENIENIDGVVNPDVKPETPPVSPPGGNDDTSGPTASDIAKAALAEVIKDKIKNYEYDYAKIEGKTITISTNIIPEGTGILVELAKIEEIVGYSINGVESKLYNNDNSRKDFITIKEMILFDVAAALYDDNTINVIINGSINGVDFSDDYEFKFVVPG